MKSDNVLILALTMYALTPAAIGQTSELPDGAMLLHQREAATNRYRSLRLAMTMTAEDNSGGASRSSVSRASMTLAPPYKVRAEIESGDTKVTIALDGQSLTVYERKSNTYSQRAVRVNPSMLGFSPQAGGSKERILTRGEEAVELDGKLRACWLVEEQLDPMDADMAIPEDADIKSALRTHWLDKQLGIELRSRTEVRVRISGQDEDVIKALAIVATSLTLDEPVADSVFAFPRPAGAIRMDQLLETSFLKPRLVGRNAPEFRLTAAGKFVTKTSLAAKAILLSFGTESCDPCRLAEASIDKLERELGTNGLVRIDIPEHEKDLIAAYRVAAFPTLVVIGPDGIVAGEQLGFAGESAIRGLLEHAIRKK